MNKDEVRNLMMDYMFGELNEAQRHEFENYISQHADLKQELEELTQTRSLLQHLPAESPTEQLVIMEPEASTDPTESIWSKLSNLLIPQHIFAKTAFSIATFVFLFFRTKGVYYFICISSANNGIPAHEYLYRADNVNHFNRHWYNWALLLF